MTGFSMTGVAYRAIQLGPVPATYDMLYNKLQEDELICISQISFDNGNYGEAIAGRKEFDETLFSKEEIEILNRVIKKFGQMRTNEVVDLSHDEMAWKENKDEKELISYSKYAFDVKHI